MIVSIANDGLKCANGTGAQGPRAGIAVETRQTDCLRVAPIDVSMKKTRDITVTESRYDKLHASAQMSDSPLLYFTQCQYTPDIF